MPCTPTFTTANLTALQQAIADGVTTVKYDDKLVQYRTLAEMMQILAMMRSELCGNDVDGKIAGSMGKVFANSSKGL